MASLRELQASFAAALHDPVAACPVLPPANLGIYRNNASFTFRETLAGTFPIVRQRVGDDYFRQLAAQYRTRYPSSCGDLHFFGRDFPRFLDEQLGGGDYAWLADLARLEWMCAESLVAPILPALGAETLGCFAPADLENLEFALQPSLRLHSSSYPVFTVWRANQVENAPPVDQSATGERGIALCRDGGLHVQTVTTPLFPFLSALQRHATLADAMTSAGLDEHALLDALGFLFREGLVTGLSPRATR